MSEASLLLSISEWYRKAVEDPDYFHIFQELVEAVFVFHLFGLVSSEVHDFADCLLQCYEFSYAEDAPPEPSLDDLNRWLDE